MTEAIAAGVTAFALSLALESAILRRMPGRASAATALLRLALFAWLYVAWLALWGAPWGAAFGAVCTIGVMAGLSLGKRRILGEPLAFSDFGLIPLVVRFPRLYLLEGVGLWIFWTVVLACVVLVAATQPAEPALGPAARAAILAGSGLLLLGLPYLAGLPPLADALRSAIPEPEGEDGIAHRGILAALFVGWLRWAGDVMRPPALPSRDDIEDAPLAPDLVVAVQLESFLDPVRAGLDPAPLAHLERARALAVAQGPLAVSAYGAFTMRTEHAMLTGLSDSDLGFRRLDPYLTARGPAPATLASRLASRGWRTLFMHPFPGRFFGRDRIMPWLGFRELHFAPFFAECQTIGPYVSDAAFARRIVAEAERAAGPALILAVTMENHGPFSRHRNVGPTDDRAQHMLHLRNTDAAIGILIDGLARLPRRTLLCLYGDHPPALKAFPPGRRLPETDYAVLLLGAGIASPQPPPARPLSADALGRLLARLAGPVTPAGDGRTA